MFKTFLNWLCCIVLLGATSGGLAVGAESEANFVAEVTFNPELLADIEITFVCTTGTPGRLSTRLQANTTFNWTSGQIDSGATFCQVYAELPRGFSVGYMASGNSMSRVDENGCQYAEVRSGESNRCLITVTQDHVPVTVYKKWIGATGDEADVQVTLDCAGGILVGRGFINQGLPTTWQLDGIPPEGKLCSVTEAGDESFTSDESDCKDLLILPGRGEACTMVNTKVVKRIEMLNRYGKIIMIVVMLTAGLIAVRRYV
jgi:hypothetical protein